MKKAIITGITGQLAYYLVEALSVQNIPILLHEYRIPFFDLN